MNEDIRKPQVSEILRGLKVVDFSTFMAGPYCSRWLADLGADVVKIEPLSGDYMRTQSPVRDGYSSSFGQLNAGKRSVSVDLKKPEGREIAKSLCLKSDIVIEAFRPGVMARLGLGAEDLRKENPRLIYCSISGFGQTGSTARNPAYAQNVHASSGFYMANFRLQDGLDRPANSGIPVADVLTSVFASFSIQVALLNREHTGEGTTIDLNLMDSIMAAIVHDLQEAQFPQPRRRRIFKPLRALDGFVVVSPSNQNNFEALCATAGQPEWLKDPIFLNEASRAANWDELLRRIESWTIERPSAECERVLMEAGVPCSRYRGVEEALEDIQFVERNTFSEVTDRAGSYRVPKLPFAFDGNKPDVGKNIPNAGEDSAEVVSSWLELEASQVRQLVAGGVIGGPS